MSYTYLYINFALLLLSVLLFSSKKVDFKGQRKYIILAAMITVFAFSVPTEFLTQLKVFVFNPPYLTGIILWELPLEESLLTLLLPLCGLSAYLFLNAKYPKNTLEKYSLALSNILLGISIAMIFFGYQKLYTMYTFVILLVFLLYIEYVNKLRFMYKFYRAYLFSLIPFYVVFGILTSTPVIQYTTSETLDFRLGQIPFETHFYFMDMLLLTVYLFELFKSRAKH